MEKEHGEEAPGAHAKSGDGDERHVRQPRLPRGQPKKAKGSLRGEPLPFGIDRSREANLAKNRLLIAQGIGCADAGAGVVTEKGEDGVFAARAVDDVVEGTAEDVVIEFAVFILAGIAEATGGIDDAGQRGCGNAGTTDNEPARSENRVAIPDPDACRWIGVEGKVRSAARITDDKADAVLERRARLNQAGAAAGVLPSVLENEVTRVRAARDTCAARRDDVWRNAGVFGARAVTRGSK
jgi:hypothetical protein